MNPLKMKLLDEVLEHLSNSQGKDLKSLLDSSKMPPEGSPEEESKESPEMEALETGKPKGIAIEKVSIMGKPKNPLAGKEDSFDDKASGAMDEISKKPGDMDKLPGEEEMSDSELEELLKKYLS